MFSLKTLIVLAFAPTVVALKFDCWNTFSCTGNPQATCQCEKIPGSNNCVSDGLPCFQALSPESCFEKGLLGASIWGDVNSNNVPNKCFMNKYDCWNDCECSKEDYPQPKWYNTANVNSPSNAMGTLNGITGWEACFAADATSASIWGASFYQAYAALGAYTSTPHYAAAVGDYATIPYNYQCQVDPASTCDVGGGGFGDPHFRAVTGEIFDFQGECDLVFLEAPTMDLTMHVRTKISQANTYSFIEAAAVQINGDVVEIGDYGSIIINGIYNADDRELPKTVGGYPLELERSDKKTHTYRIVVDPNLNHYIELKSFTFMVGVSVSLPKDHMMDATGLFGSVKEDGAKMGRDGVTVFANVDAYGQDWVVGTEDPALFEADPWHFGKCVMPKYDLQHNQRLGGISQKDAEKACAHMGLNKNACVTDVITANDLELAMAY